jgi:5-hydroxyisourate hydrolase-like protein (transthyretin family)
MILQMFLWALTAAGWRQLQSPSASALASQQQSFRISGMVVDAMNGQPLVHAQVSISAQGTRDSGQSQSAVTEEDGRFVFENLAAGHYTLFSRHRGYLQQFYKQHEQFSTAIIVGPDLNTENLRFEMKPDASISGQVLDEMGEPVRNAQVMLFRHGVALGRRSNWQENTVQTDDLGHFRFGHLEPATYVIGVSASPWYAQRVMHLRETRTDSSGQTTFRDFANGEPELDVVYPITFFPNAPDISGAAPITLHSGDTETADLRLQPVPSLHVIVRTASAAASPGDSTENENVWAQVTQVVADGVQMGVQASNQQIAPGVVEVSGLPPGRFNLRVNSNKNGETVSRSEDMQLGGDAEVTLSEANASGTVSGIAKLESGAAQVPAPVIQLHARATGERFMARAEQSGEFSLKDQAVPPGTYDVLVVQPAAMAVKSMSASGAKVSGRSLELAGGQDVRLNIVLSEGTGRVTGVALKDGKPMDGVMIVLVPEVPEHNLVLFRRDQSDSDGSFALPGVHPGKYTVVAIENGWELEWLTPGMLEKYLAGGEPVRVTANAKIEVKVKVQQPE